MMQFASEFTEEKIVAQLARQLSWSHFVEVLPIKDSLAREFYLTLSATNRWSRNKGCAIYDRVATKGCFDSADSKVHGDSQRFGQVLNFVILHQNYFSVSIIFRTFALEREASLAPLPPDKLNV